MLTREALATCNDFADWVKDHKNSVPEWFPVDSARDAFAATYPFHPTVLSVFERKWQVLPRFQQTRGVLRLLALWVSRSYQEGFKGGQRDRLIGLGTAPLDDPQFRAAMFEQLGDHRLKPPSPPTSAARIPTPPAWMLKPSSPFAKTDCTAR